MAAPLGSAPGIIVGVGVGTAAAAALEPAVELPRQAAWANNPNRLLDPPTLARLVAQGGLDLAAAQAEAARDGYAADKMHGLVYLAQSVPTEAMAMNLWRRGLISDQLWTHALVKSGVDPRYYPALNQLKLAEIIGVGDLAYAVVRGMVPAPSWVPVAPPAHGDKVPRFPQVNIDVEAEAAKLGFDAQMFQIMVGRSGLSMAPVMAARAFFRNIIGPNDYLLAIAEGDLRTEWADAVREVSREILTAHNYAELELRGWITTAERLQLTAQHGMSAADSDLLFKVLGRPIPEHQVVTGEARGGSYGGPSNAIPAPFLKALQESNIRPEWYNLAYANRYTYPSAFVLRSLATAGDLTQAETHQILLEIGWRPDLAQLVSARWAASAGGATTADKHVGKAQTQLWNTAHRVYVAGDADTAEATAALQAAGVTDTAGVLAVWDHERQLARKELSAAQVKKAWAEGKMTRQAAVAELTTRGYTVADANTLLDE